MRWAVALVAIAVAFAWPQQGAGWEENAHYALVLALSEGTPYVENVKARIGGLGTGDLAVRSGHEYAITAPGHPFASLPLFLVLEKAGMRTTGDPTHALWAIGLLGVVVPAVILVALVRHRGERVAPRYGTTTAVAFAFGTLLLPFATLYMSHALSACLAFAAFTVLWREREGPEQLWLVGIAGVLAGLAVTAEYQAAVAGTIIGIYALARSRPAIRAAAYASGVVAGVLPAAAYHFWAFGSPFHVAYLDGPAADAFDRGVLGFGVPSGRALLEMLFSEQGLLTLSPVVAAGVVGTVLLYRGGRRAEAGVIGGIGAAYCLYAAGFFTPFGGIWPGPRYLIVTLPFLLTAAAPAFRALPLTTAALAVVSISTMTALTATHAHAAYHQRWFERIADREFPTTALASIGITGWYAIVPFFVAVVVAVFAAARSLPLFVVTRNDLLTTACALAAWIVIGLGAPRRGELGGPGLEFSSYWPVGVVGGVALAALGARFAVRGDRRLRHRVA